MAIRARRRRLLGTATAGLLVCGVVSTYALPAFAADLTESAPPVESEDVQQLRVGSDVSRSPAGISDWAASEESSWVAPTSGELRDGFGPRWQRPVAGVSGMHRGQDLGAACGSPVRASSSGVVQQAGWFGTYGNWVLLQHGAGISTGYAHNSTLLVTAGQRVRTGQVIAYAGTTGASTGCHVHLEVRAGTTALNPVTFMRARGVPLG